MRYRFVRLWLRRPAHSRKIIFTDEKLFRGSPSNSRIIVRRLPGERFLEQNIAYDKPAGPSCNFWYSIGPKGKGRLFLAENIKLYDSFGNKISNPKYEGFDSDSYC